MRQTNTPEVRGENPLGYAPIGQLLLRFSVPSVISMLVNALYNIVDQIFIGQGVGVLGNAATTVAFPIMTISLAFSSLLGSGGCAYAAIKMGEGRGEEADRTLNNQFILTIVAGVALAVLGLVFLDPLLVGFGASEAILPYARDYTSVILIGLPFSTVSVALSSMARTDGSPRLSMYGILIGAGLNTILDPLYIFVFGWGVKGAALATITSQAISAIILVVYFMKFSHHMRLKRSAMRPSGLVCEKIVALGISSGITQGVACIMQVVMNNVLRTYGDQTAIGGDVALSAMGIVMKIAMILGAVGVGISIGAQPILGFNRGARHYHRVRRTYLLSVVAATGGIALGWLACQTVPELILKIFGNNNAAFTEFATRCLRIYLFGVFCAGFQIVSTGYFQATGQPLKASLLSSLRQLLLLVPLLVILPMFLGLDGVLFAGPVADVGSALIVLLFILPEMKKLDRLVREEDAGGSGQPGQQPA